MVFKREIKRKRGFFTLAQNGEHDYLRMAYALALSLRVTQKDYGYLSVGVTPGTVIPPHYYEVIDEIIEIPWGDLAEHEDWKLSNEWKAYHMSPYEETIKLDADMLFTSDVSWWWDILYEQNIWISNASKTYRNEVANTEWYRQVFIQNKIPSAYSALSYFKVNQESLRFFKCVEDIYKNFSKYHLEMIKTVPQERATTDVVYGMAVDILGKESEYMRNADWFQMVHMKSMCQRWEMNVVDTPWIEHVPYSITDIGEIMIANFKQTYPLHYHVKEFLTDDIIKTYEAILNE